MKILKTLALAAGALIVLGTAARADTVLGYKFDPGTTFDFGADNTYAATGTFDYDVTTSMVTNVDYTATQTGTGPAGPFVFTGAITNSSTDVSFINDGTGIDVDEFIFEDSLADGFGVDPINNFLYIGNPIVGVTGSVSLTGVTGGVPEPAAWAMLILGLGFTGLALRRRPVAVPA